LIEDGVHCTERKKFIRQSGNQEVDIRRTGEQEGKSEVGNQKTEIKEKKEKIQIKN